MICPTCKSDMIVVEHEDIELDYCPGCRGVWFDSGELELLLESVGLPGDGLDINSIISAPEAETHEKKRKCPICSIKMKKASMGHEEKILIDACGIGDGLWFDAGEVHQLVEHLSSKNTDKADSQQKVINFLGEVFKA